MPGQSVTIEMTADDRDVLRAFQKQQAEILKNQRALMKTGQAGKRAGKEAATGIDKAVSSVKEFASSVVGIGSVVGAIAGAASALQNELDEMRRRQRISRVEASTLAAQARLARMNFEEDKTVQSEDLEKRFMAIGERTRTDPKLIAAAATDALSAKGSLSNEVALRAVEQAFRIAPGNLGVGRELSGRILDILKVTGGKDPRAAAGFLMNVQGAARVTSLRKVGAAGVPTITSLRKMGDSTEEGGELFAAMSQMMSDVTGDRSKTATINLAKRLGEFVPEEQAKDERGKFTVPEKQIQAFEGAEDTQERIKVMQESPELRRAFFAQTSFSAEATGAIRGLLAGQKSSVRELRRAQRLIEAPGPAQTQRLERKVAELEGGRFQPVRTVEQKSRENVRQAQLRSTRRQRVSSARNVLRSTLEAVNMPGLDTMGFRLPLAGDLGARGQTMRNFEAATLAGNAPPELVASRQLRATVRSLSMGGVTEAEREDIKLLRAQARLLEEQALKRVKTPGEIEEFRASVSRQIGRAESGIVRAERAKFGPNDQTQKERIRVLEKQIQRMDRLIEILENREEQQETNRLLREQNDQLKEQNRQMANRRRAAQTAGARQVHTEPAR